MKTLVYWSLGTRCSYWWLPDATECSRTFKNMGKEFFFAIGYFHHSASTQNQCLFHWLLYILSVVSPSDHNKQCPLCICVCGGADPKVLKLISKNDVHTPVLHAIPFKVIFPSWYFFQNPCHFQKQCWKSSLFCYWVLLSQYYWNVIKSLPFQLHFDS